MTVDPAAGLAVKVTLVPSSKSWSQSVPQSIPAGALVTDPDPLPALVTEPAVTGAVPVTVAVPELDACRASPP